MGVRVSWGNIAETMSVVRASGLVLVCAGRLRLPAGVAVTLTHDAVCADSVVLGQVDRGGGQLTAFSHPQPSLDDLDVVVRDRSASASVRPLSLSPCSMTFDRLRLLDRRWRPDGAVIVSVSCDGEQLPLAGRVADSPDGRACVRLDELSSSRLDGFLTRVRDSQARLLLAELSAPAVL